MKTEKGEFEAVATRVSSLCLAGNLLLSAFKFLAGFLGNSGAMISDAVHSSSDIVGGLIVLVSVRISSRPSDSEHPYGHERMECVAALVLGNILLVVGGLIGWKALQSVAGGTYLTEEQPGGIALAAAVVSIIAKEGMFWYTWAAARKINSSALRAEAWHHRSDALSSAGALAGIAGARHGFPVLEPVAGAVIAVFILKAALDIFRDALNKVVDHSCSEATQAELRRCVLSQPGVLGIDLLNTREFGSRVYADIEIRADGTLSLKDAHHIAEAVHSAVEKNFPQVKHIMVHVNPA